MHRYAIGDPVRFEGIGRGEVVHVEKIGVRVAYLVKFYNYPVAHLCRGHELQKARRRPQSPILRAPQMPDGWRK